MATKIYVCVCSFFREREKVKVKKKENTSVAKQQLTRFKRLFLHEIIMLPFILNCATVKAGKLKKE